MQNRDWHTRFCPTSALALALALALAGACGPPAAAEPAAPVAPPTAETVVAAGNRVVEQYRQAYEIESIEVLRDMYAQGLDTTVFVQGKAHRGWTAVEDYLQGLFNRVDAMRAKVSDVQVVALGKDGALVTAGLAREYKDGPLTVMEFGVLTMTLVRVDDAWLIVNEHFSYAHQ